MKMNLDCQSCTEILQKSRGCEKKAAIPAFNLDGEDFYRCPLKIITRQSIEYIRFYNFYREGYLPNTGGIMDQPGKFLDAMQIVEGAVREIEEEARKKPRK